MVIKADSSLQVLWGCDSLGRSSFRTQKDEKIRAIREKSANISEIHSQLWPGQPHPDKETIKDVFHNLQKKDQAKGDKA